MKSPYDILGITKYSTKREIREAYVRLTKQYHPDTGDGDIEKLNEVKSAYIRLKDKNLNTALTVPIIVTISKAELASVLGTTQIFEYEGIHFEVYVPYDVRIGDTLTVNDILPDTKLKIKFREHNE
jgi:hypothetical protein